MQLDAILEVAIGLIFIWLILSIVTWFLVILGVSSIVYGIWLVLAIASKGN